MHKDVIQTLEEINLFFKALCAWTLNLDLLDQLEKDIPVILCKLEKYFSPECFDVMVHLMIHLPREAKIDSPVQYRWMYSIERYS